MSELIKAHHRLVLPMNEAESQTLQEGARHHPRAQARERCAAALKVAQGHSPHWVAKHGLLLLPGVRWPAAVAVALSVTASEEP